MIDHEDAVAPDPKDPLHLILKDLGPSPSVESLIGEYRMVNSGSSPSQTASFGHTTVLWQVGTQNASHNQSFHLSILGSALAGPIGFGYIK